MGWKSTCRYCPDNTAADGWTRLCFLSLSVDYNHVGDARCQVFFYAGGSIDGTDKVLRRYAATQHTARCIGGVAATADYVEAIPLEFEFPKNLAAETADPYWPKDSGVTCEIKRRCLLASNGRCPSMLLNSVSMLSVESVFWCRNCKLAFLREHVRVYLQDATAAHGPVKTAHSAVVLLDGDLQSLPTQPSLRHAVESVIGLTSCCAPSYSILSVKVVLRVGSEFDAVFANGRQTSPPSFYYDTFATVTQPTLLELGLEIT